MARFEDTFYTLYQIWAFVLSNRKELLSILYRSLLNFVRTTVARSVKEGVRLFQRITGNSTLHGRSSILGMVLLSKLERLAKSKTLQDLIKCDCENLIIEIGKKNNKKLTKY